VNLISARSAFALIVAAAAAASLAGQTAPKWRVQYFYDEEKSTFNIVDLNFPSTTRGVAVGSIVEGSRQKHVAVVTSDSGAHWTTVNLDEPPVSLFFLRENLGWMVTTKGLWQTTETGRNWRKLPKVPGQIIRVAFVDEKNGYAAGIKKKVYQTHDGGQSWTAVAAAAEPPGNADYSAYTWIAFPTAKDGIVTGWNLPPRRDQRLPDWLDPEAAARRRDTPHLSYSLETHDGGATWVAKSASLFGQVTRLRYAPQGFGLGLIEHSASFRYPAEVYRVDRGTGKIQTVFRDKRFAITDLWLDREGTAYLAGTQVVGQVRNVAPGKVQVLRTKDFLTWEEMAVDYKAVANRVVMAVADEKNMWLATDNGMILKYQ
jgi:photosystem II stability/assembly factor-like uncharacterized protein